MTKSRIQALLVVALLLPGLVFLWNTGDLTYYGRRPVPPGQIPYVGSRLFALYALTLVWLQILLGALRPDLERVLGLRESTRLHTRLGVATLCLLLGHVALFQAGVMIRSGHFPTANLLPDFFSHYYANRIAIGATALYLAIAGAFAAGFRRRRWMSNSWRKIHAVNYVVFALGAWHGLAIGSDTRLQPLYALIFFFLGSVALAALWRAFSSTGRSLSLRRLPVR